MDGNKKKIAILIGLAIIFVAPATIYSIGGFDVRATNKEDVQLDAPEPGTAPLSEEEDATEATDAKEDVRFDVSEPEDVKGLPDILEDPEILTDQDINLLKAEGDTLVIKSQYGDRKIKEVRGLDLFYAFDDRKFNDRFGDGVTKIRFEEGIKYISLFIDQGTVSDIYFPSTMEGIGQIAYYRDGDNDTGLPDDIKYHFTYDGAEHVVSAHSFHCATDDWFKPVEGRDYLYPPVQCFALAEYLDIECPNGTFQEKIAKIEEVREEIRKESGL